jgi:RNA polymerase sigma-70 factor (ECF subfamily)
LERARALDHGALSMLYTRYLPVVYRAVLGRVSDVHLAEDLTSETFFAMVESIERLRATDEMGFAAWLLGIGRNKVAEHYRRQAARPSIRGELESWEEPATEAEEGDPAQVVAARERWSEVAEALKQLTEEQRTVVLYRCVLGYSAVDVARLMDREPGAIRQLQFRALAALARYLAAHGTNPSVPAIRAVLGSPTRTHRSAAQGGDDDAGR